MGGHIAGRMLQRTDWFTQEKAATLLTAIIVARPNKSTAEVSQAPIAMNGFASSSSLSAANHAPPPVPTPTAESETVQNVLLSFIDWLTSQLKCAPVVAPPLNRQDFIGRHSVP